MVGVFNGDFFDSIASSAVAIAGDFMGNAVFVGAAVIIDADCNLLVNSFRDVVKIGVEIFEVGWKGASVYSGNGEIRIKERSLSRMNISSL